MTNRSKYWYESLTLWLNGLAVLIALAGFALEAVTNGALPLMPDPRLVALLLGGANLVMRLRVQQPIRRKES